MKPTPYQRFPCGAGGKEPACRGGDVSDQGSIPGSGRSPGGGHGNPLRYSCLENPMHRGAWRATVHGVAASRTQLHSWAHTHACCISENSAVSIKTPVTKSSPRTRRSDRKWRDWKSGNPHVPRKCKTFPQRKLHTKNASVVESRMSKEIL